MAHLAICTTCHFPFAFEAALETAFCSRCGERAIVSDGSVAGIFRAVHEGFPAAMPRREKRALLKVLGDLAAGKITVDEALENRSMSPEAAQIILTLIGLGLDAIVAVFMVIMALQAQAREEADGIEAREDRRELYSVVADNLGAMQTTQEAVLDRLRRLEEVEEYGEAQEPERKPTRTRQQNRDETASSPKPRAPRVPSRSKGKKKQS